MTIDEERVNTIYKLNIPIHSDWGWCDAALLLLADTVNQREVGWFTITHNFSTGKYLAFENILWHSHIVLSKTFQASGFECRTSRRGVSVRLYLFYFTYFIKQLSVNKEPIWFNYTKMKLLVTKMYITLEKQFITQLMTIKIILKCHLNFKLGLGKKTYANSL